MNQQKKKEGSWPDAIAFVLLMIISALAGTGAFYFLRVDGFMEALGLGMFISAFSAGILNMILLKALKNKKKESR